MQQQTPKTLTFKVNSFRCDQNHCLKCLLVDQLLDVILFLILTTFFTWAAADELYSLLRLRVESAASEQRDFILSILQYLQLSCVFIIRTSVCSVARKRLLSALMTQNDTEKCESAEVVLNRCRPLRHEPLRSTLSDAAVVNG